VIPPGARVGEFQSEGAPAPPPPSRVPASAVVGAALLLGLVVALGFTLSRRPARAPVPGAAAPGILWSIDVPGSDAASGVVVSHENVLFAAGTEPSDPPPGYASVEVFSRTALYAFDAQGKLKTKVVGRIGRRVETFESLQLCLAPWGAAYGIDSQGGLYGLWPDGRGAFRVSGVRGSISGPPVVAANGRVFVGGSSLWGLDLEGHDPIGLQLPVEGVSAPSIAPDGTFYTASLRGVHAIAEDGRPLWFRKMEYPRRPILDPGFSLYVAGPRMLTSLTLDGSVQWEFPLEGDAGTAPVVAPDGTVHIGTQSGLLYAFTRAGRLKWTRPLAAPISHEMTLDAGGDLWVGDTTGGLYRIDAEGKERWRGSVPAAPSTPQIGSDGVLYVLADQKLYALKP
jgi:hypothetical protein